MAAVDPTAAMARIVTVLQGLSGMQTVYRGVPASLDTRVSAYVTMDRWDTTDGPAPSLIRHEVDFGITLGYRVSGDVSAAETTLATLAGAAISAFAGQRRGRLSGTVESLGLLTFARAAEPQYVVVVGSEFRIYPGVLRATYSEGF